MKKLLNTAVFDNSDGFKTVVYYSTPIVKFNDSQIILNSGGYMTSSTKKRMNQISEEFDLGFYVYQVNKQWFVDKNGIPQLFYDGISL